MSRLKKPTKQVLIRLFEEDLETMKDFYPGAGYNAAIRELVARHCRKLREKDARTK